jgi:hypothetical protein
MYLTHAVRSIRDDPIEGEDVTLLLEAVDEDCLDGLAAAVRDLGGTVEAEHRFATLEVTLSQERVADLCALDGIDHVETANSLTVDADGAGEDVRPE